jgi:hypothetical protein
MLKSIQTVVLFTICVPGIAGAQQIPNGAFADGLSAWQDRSVGDASVSAVVLSEESVAEFVTDDGQPLAAFATLRSEPVIVTHERIGLLARSNSVDDGFSLSLVDDSELIFTTQFFESNTSVWTEYNLDTSTGCGEVLSFQVGYTALLSDGAEDRAWVDDVLLSGEICATFLDADGDGFCPLGYDLDGDGICLAADEIDLAGVDCDDTDDDRYPGRTWFADFDGDGYGTTDFVLYGCEQPSGGAPFAGDCNEGDDSIHPGAFEIPADGVDQTCDALEQCYADDDGDGFAGERLTLSSSLLCDAAGVSDVSEDCDDEDPDARPGAEWYEDLDGDGYASGGASVVQCPRPAGWTVFTGDCDDTKSFVSPAAEETPGDGFDQDCDGGELCYLDLDGDGYGSGVVDSEDLDCTDAFESSQEGDCNDDDPTRWGPDTGYIDADGDGFGDPVTAIVFGCDIPDEYVVFGGDCDDTNTAFSPGADETPVDGVDQDCDGFELCYEDLDWDTYGSDALVVSDAFFCDVVGVSAVSEDCDDTNNAVNPEAQEIPGNGLDDDCEDGDASNPTTGMPMDGGPATRPWDTPTAKDAAYTPAPYAPPFVADGSDITGYSNGACGGCSSQSMSGSWFGAFAALLVLIGRRRTSPLAS